MPKKSPEERIRRAKAAGTTATIKADDPGVRPRETTLSPHATKKSRWNVGEGHPEGRSVSHQSPPHEGTMRRPPLEGEARAAMPDDLRAALPREEREAERIRQGRPERLSPATKGRGEP